MSARAFHAIEVHRQTPVLEALKLAKSDGHIVGHDFFHERTRFVSQDLHRARPALVELTFYRLQVMTPFDDVLLDLDAQGLRPADLLEALALMRRRPEFFHTKENFPLHVLGEPILAPQVCARTCIPVFPEDGASPPPPLWLVERGNHLGAIVILAAKKAAA